jgi:hypothetical protein
MVRKGFYYINQKDDGRFHEKEVIAFQKGLWKKGDG